MVVVETAAMEEKAEKAEKHLLLLDCLVADQINPVVLAETAATPVVVARSLQVNYKGN